MAAGDGAVIVTGASRGIGLEVARRLTEDGLRVVGLSRFEGDTPTLRARYPDRFTWIRADVTDDAAIVAAVDGAATGPGGLRAVVCAAGAVVFGSVEDTAEAHSVAQLDVNYHGVVRTVRAALPHLRAAGAGRIVVIGSLAGRAPVPFHAHYAASKAALDALVLSLRAELCSTSVTASLVEPGDIRTTIVERTRWIQPSRAYQRNARAVEAVARRSAAEGPSPACVVDAVVRALTARRPRVRYPVGPDRWTVAAARRLLPDGISLGLLRRHYGMRTAS